MNEFNLADLTKFYKPLSHIYLDYNYFIIIKKTIVPLCFCFVQKNVSHSFDTIPISFFTPNQVKFTAVDTDKGKRHRFDHQWSETANLFQGLKFPPQQARIENTCNRKISGFGCIPDMF